MAETGKRWQNDLHSVGRLGLVCAMLLCTQLKKVQEYLLKYGRMEIHNVTDSTTSVIFAVIEKAEVVNGVNDAGVGGPKPVLETRGVWWHQ